MIEYLKSLFSRPRPEDNTQNVSIVDEESPEQSIPEDMLGIPVKAIIQDMENNPRNWKVRDGKKALRGGEEDKAFIEKALTYSNGFSFYRGGQRHTPFQVVHCPSARLFTGLISVLYCHSDSSPQLYSVDFAGRGVGFNLNKWEIEALRRALRHLAENVHERKLRVLEVVRARELAEREIREASAREALAVELGLV